MFTLERIAARRGQLLGVIGPPYSAGRDKFDEEREPSFSHQLVVPITLHSAEGESLETDLRVDSIDFGVRSWRELAGQSYPFSTEPSRLFHEDGETIPDYQLYAAIRLLETYRRVEITQIRFGTRSGCTLQVRLDMSIDASDEEPRFACDRGGVTLETDLHIGEVRVTSGEDPEAVGSEQARELAARFLELTDYVERMVDGIVNYAPLCE